MPAEFEYTATGGSAREIPIPIGGNGKLKRTYRFGKFVESRGFQWSSISPPFTVAGKCSAIGNGGGGKSRLPWNAKSQSAFASLMGL